MKNNRQAFLETLPLSNIKRPLLKSIFIVLFGILLGTILVGLFGNLIGRIQDTGYRYFLSTIVQDIPIMVLFVMFFYGGSISKLLKNLLLKNKHNTILITVLSFLILFLITFVLVFVSAIQDTSFINSKEIENYFNSNAGFTYIVGSLLGLFLYILLAFFEEFIFRFTIFRHLRRKGLFFALIVSSLIFSLVHFNIGLPFSFIAGVIFAIHYEYTNNLITTALLHGLHNYLSFYYASYIVYQILK